MKKRYIKPKIEAYRYSAEKGYWVSVALHRDYVLIEGNDHNSLRASDEMTEFTDFSGEYATGIWD